MRRYFFFLLDRSRLLPSALHLPALVSKQKKIHFLMSRFTFSPTVHLIIHSFRLNRLSSLYTLSRGLFSSSIISTLIDSSSPENLENYVNMSLEKTLQIRRNYDLCPPVG